MVWNKWWVGPYFHHLRFDSGHVTLAAIIELLVQLQFQLQRWIRVVHTTRQCKTKK